MKLHESGEDYLERSLFCSRKKEWFALLMCLSIWV